jgi:hypothetical protein
MTTLTANKYKQAEDYATKPYIKRRKTYSIAVFVASLIGTVISLVQLFLLAQPFFVNTGLIITDTSIIKVSPYISASTFWLASLSCVFFIVFNCVSFSVIWCKLYDNVFDLGMLMILVILIGYATLPFVLFSTYIISPALDGKASYMEGQLPDAAKELAKDILGTDIKVNASEVNGKIISFEKGNDTYDFKATIDGLTTTWTLEKVSSN